LQIFGINTLSSTVQTGSAPEPDPPNLFSAIQSEVWPIPLNLSQVLFCVLKICK
jgi:hypothetical protein